MKPRFSLEPRTNFYNVYERTRSGTYKEFIKKEPKRKVASYVLNLLRTTFIRVRVVAC